MENEVKNKADSYVNFLAARMFALVSGMNAENKQREVQGESMAYTEDAYYEIVTIHDKALDNYYYRK